MTPGVFDDLKGKRFGRLIVLKIDTTINKKSIYWKCKCDCGKVKSIRGSSLKSGATRSCGCISVENGRKRKFDLLGKRFGRLLVIKEIERLEKQKTILWECQCDCGKVTQTTSKCLLSGSSRSCGCYNKERTRETHFKGEGVSQKHTKYLKYIAGAKDRGLDFELSEILFNELIEMPCYYCGKNGEILGVDRVDNSVGYIESNVVPCCERCNRGKTNLTIQEFVEWIYKVYKNFIRGKIKVDQEMMSRIKFSCISEYAKAPMRKYSTDAGLDLYAHIPDNNSVYIAPQNYAIIGTGIMIEIPAGCVGLIWPKSRNNYLIGGGVIDEDYQNEILVKIINTSSEILKINNGDAIAQLLIQPILTPAIEEVDLSDIHQQKTDRGATGGIVEQLDKN